MAIAPITLLITRANNLTLLQTPSGALTVDAGSQFDNETHELEFAREPEYDADTLVLYFDDARVVLGQSNTFRIPAALTQQLKINLQVAFIRDGEELEHSNIVVLRFRESLRASETPPQPMPDIVLQLADQALTDVSISETGEEVIYTNLAGDERSRIPFGGGGGSGTFDHNKLINRGLPNQHPAAAIGFIDGEDLQYKIDTLQATIGSF